MNKFFALIFFLFLSTDAYVYEHNTINSLLNYITELDHHKDTLVLFDIDNTLAHPKGLIGSDQWVNYLIQHKMSDGFCSFEDALQFYLPCFYLIQQNIDLQLVEQESLYLIQFLQNNGICVLALTARSIPIADRTIKQLENLGIQFLNYFDEQSIAHKKTPYLYKRGIIFCGSACKGKLLKAFLEDVNYYPKKVIMIDDKEKPLHGIRNALDSSIMFVGIRYSHLDHFVSSFDPMQAHHELLAFLAAISNSKYVHV